MRRIPYAMYRKESWASVIKSSGLPRAVANLGDPSGLAKWRTPLMTQLYSKYALEMSLHLVLHSWIVKSIPTPVIPATIVLPSRPVGRPKIDSGHQLFEVLATTSEIRFFLVSLDNFQEAWSQWLRYSLENQGYDATSWGTQEGQTLKQLHRDFMRCLRKADKEETLVATVEDPILRRILERTLKVGASMTTADRGMRLPGRNNHEPCRQCKDSKLSPDESCVQDIVVSVSTCQDWVGCGVSLHPPDKVVKADVTPEAMKTPKQVLQPHELGLQRIAPKEHIIQRCGRQIFRLIDAATGTLRDVYVYGAFPEATLAQLRTHTSRYSKLKGVQRGAQFEQYSTGNMVPRGERAPKGGAPGDCFGYYANMTPTSVDHIDVLFDHAEDAGILMRAAKVFFPDAHKGLKEAGSIGERLGGTAATIFYCGNYTAPLHCDDDACPGLCAQLDLHADSNYDEYAFVNLAYSCYFVCRENSFCDVHGTMLPSSEPLQAAGAPGGGGHPNPRVSNGLHKAKPKRNAQAAKRYAQVRENRQAIEQYWWGV
ncbi:hypothetical protein BKA70DRAFT_1349453 [Coprinopsis sp. MPI-PUGE-AT-0042]|nr:hypothetical protein BKA70DRAFT_1349453 [Coprinopsis sp. MPI-PUGE-AT-0042]